MLTLRAVCIGCTPLYAFIARVMMGLGGAERDVLTRFSPPAMSGGERQAVCCSRDRHRTEAAPRGPQSAGAAHFGRVRACFPVGSVAPSRPRSFSRLNDFDSPPRHLRLDTAAAATSQRARREDAGDAASAGFACDATTDVRVLLVSVPPSGPGARMACARWRSSSSHADLRARLAAERLVHGLAFPRIPCSLPPRCLRASSPSSNGRSMRIRGCFARIPRHLEADGG